MKLTVTQEQVTYYATPNRSEFEIGRFPVFIWQSDPVIYGFPVYGEATTKAAIDAANLPVIPETRTYTPNRRREQVLDEWLNRSTPGFPGPKLYTKKCLYTLTPDRNFILDFLPEHPNILVCVNAGHAFKFAGLLGKALCDLAVQKRTEYPIAPFSIHRPSLTVPDSATNFRL